MNVLTTDHKTLRLNRVYYANKVITSGRFKGDHETYAQSSTEESILSEASKSNTTIVRVDRIMKFEADRNIWSEDLRVCYQYDTETGTWKFSALWESLNKIR